MSKRKTQVEKAIEQLEGEIAVLQAAIAKLREQQARQAKGFIPMRKVTHANL